MWRDGECFYRDDESDESAAFAGIVTVSARVWAVVVFFFFFFFFFFFSRGKIRRECGGDGLLLLFLFLLRGERGRL